MMPKPKSRLSLILIVGGLLALGLALFGGSTLAQSPPPSPEFPLAMAPENELLNSTHFALDWSVIGTGGGNLSSAHFQLSGTIGQTGVGLQNSAHFDACSGFWCAVGNFIRRLYLPLTLQNY